MDDATILEVGGDGLVCSRSQPSVPSPVLQSCSIGIPTAQMVEEPTSEALAPQFAYDDSALIFWPAHLCWGASHVI